MAHILFISPYYPPEKAAAAVCISETAIRLVQSGHQVTVLTTVPNYPTGIVPLQYRGRLLQREVLDGVDVVRVWSYVSANKGFFRRVLAQFSFGLLAPLLGGNAIGHPDLIIAHSPPLFDAIAARILAWQKHCPFIFMVSDLWPESAIQLGVLRNRLLIALAEWLEWSTYQKASLIWVVTESVRDLLIKRGLSPAHIFLLTNGVNIHTFRPLPADEARKALGWDDRYTVLYAGNHGLVYGLKTVLDAAALLREDRSIHFLFVGAGARKTELMEQAERQQLNNVTFLEAVPHEHMPQLLAAADVCLIPLSKMPLLETTLPLKMFELMACARPFILGATGIARRIAVDEAAAALAVEPEHAEELVAAIMYLRDHPEEGQALGKRGRACVEARFDYDKLTASLNARIMMLLNGKGVLIGQALSTFEGTE